MKIITSLKDILFPILLPRYQLNHQQRGCVNYIDVGSVGGLPEVWKSNAYLIRYLLNFEPNVNEKKGENSITLNSAVWSKKENREFYIYRGLNGTGSSLKKQNYDYVRTHYDSLKKIGPQTLADTWFDRSALVKTEKVSCNSLDNIIRENFPNKNFHFLKIDAQGAEYDILLGAKNLLATSCVGLHLELFTLPLYEDIILLDEVESYLEGFNFKLEKKFPAHGTFNSQHDCLFIRQDEDHELISIIRKVYGL